MKFMSGIVIPVLPVRNSDDYLPSSTTLQMISIGGTMVRVMVFNATFNNILVISVLMVEEAGVHGENHWPAASHL